MTIERTTNAVAPTPDGKPHTVDQAAGAFEALFLGHMLKAARESSDGAFGEKDQASTTMSEYAEEFFAQEIAKGGGLGLAKMIVSQIGESSKTESGKT